MAKPILLSVDYDSDVLRAIERDLRSQYGAGYRVIGNDSADGALDLLKQLKVRNDSIALFLADQRMPRMDGVEFLQQAIGILAGAKGALLHRIRGYERRDQRHQSRQHQLRNSGKVPLVGASGVVSAFSASLLARDPCNQAPRSSPDRATEKNQIRGSRPSDFTYS